MKTGNKLQRRKEVKYGIRSLSESTVWLLKTLTIKSQRLEIDYIN